MDERGNNGGSGGMPVASLKERSRGIHLEVITPEEQFFAGEAESIVLRTVEGYMGFLPGRESSCVLLHDEGRLQFRTPGSKTFTQAFLEGGFAFMDENMTIYTDYACWPVSEHEYPPEVYRLHDALAAGAEAAAAGPAGAGRGDGTRQGTPKLQPDTEPKE